MGKKLTTENEATIEEVIENLNELPMKPLTQEEEEQWKREREEHELEKMNQRIYENTLDRFIGVMVVHSKNQLQDLDLDKIQNAASIADSIADIAVKMYKKEPENNS